mmetsp:Transcript_107396/g.190175  ORF Transcript_107396/g.190175 Transcript_107396/m.190175 type:complete len:235 (-) Transcript_107396:47-751(-)
MARTLRTTRTSGLQPLHATMAGTRLAVFFSILERLMASSVATQPLWKRPLAGRVFVWSHAQSLGLSINAIASLLSVPCLIRQAKKVKFYGTPGSQIQHIGKQSINSTHDLGEVIETLNIPDLLSCVNSPQEAQGRCHGVHGHTPIPSFINFISVDVEGQGWNVLKKFPFDTVKVGAWIVEHPSAPEQDILKKHGYIDVPVQNPGVDRYYIQPQFWDDSLVQKDWRIHPPGSSGC